MSVRINPSILSSDFARLERELGSIATADAAHVDVMDGHFVPNLTFGLPVVHRLRQVSPIPFDVHLMIDDPDRWAPAYAEAGCEWVTFHLEASASPISLARTLQAAGAKAGLALRPTTPVETVIDLLEYFDQVLVMTVEPGFGGQSFIEAGSVGKLARLREAAARLNPQLSIQVDGGITRHTAPVAVGAGANCLVAGSAVFGCDDPAAAIAGLRAAAVA